MDFFNSLGEVAKNRKNFKTWEDQQADTQAQREELYKRRQYSEEEISNAKRLGERIVDVVDIMDNHSENVAENVETAIEPLVGISPTVGFLASMLAYYKTILKPSSRAIDIAYNNVFYTNDKAINLAKRISDDIRKTRPQKSDFQVSDFASKKKVNLIKNEELRKQALKINKEFMSKVGSHFKKMKYGAIGVAATTVASFVAATIFASKLQVDSSKIARYQARKMLEDPAAFVDYTPEQIAEVKKYIEEHPELKKEKKKEKLKSGMFKSIYNIIKDRKAYQQAKANDKDTSKKITRDLTVEELNQAKKDKEVIQRAVRIINNEAEKYSENMEVAANVIMGSTPIIGALTGWAIGLLMNKTGLTDKMVAKAVKDINDTEVTEAYKRFTDIKKGAPGYTARWGKFVDKLTSHKAADSINVNTEEGIRAIKNRKHIDFKIIAKKLFAATMSHRWINAKVIGLGAGLLSAIPASLIALKLQKSSARAGRYTAKRELEKDPRNFIGYTEEDLEEVKDVKGKKPTFGDKFKEVVLFVPNVLKQYYAYDKYKRTEFKDHQIMMDQLQKTKVTDEQIKDAKNLQRKLFNTFEKVDDNSQIYSESMEAATEILQPAVQTAGMLTAISPLIYAVVQIGRGKITAASAIDWTVDKLAKASKFLQSKSFKNYLKEVSEKIPHAVGNLDYEGNIASAMSRAGEDSSRMKAIMNLEYRPVATILAHMDFKNDTIGQIGSKFIKNLKDISQTFRMMDDIQQIRLIQSYEKNLLNAIKAADKDPKQFSYILDPLKGMKKLDPRTRADLLDLMLKNTDVVQRMKPENFERAKKAYINLLVDTVGKDKVLSILKAIQSNIEPDSDFADIFYKFANKYSQVFPDENIIDINGLKKVLSDSISQEDYIMISKKIDDFASKHSKHFNVTFADAPKVIDEFLTKFKVMSEQKPDLNRRTLSGAVDPKATSRAGESLFEDISSNLRPKKIIQNFAEEVKNMSDQQFRDLADLHRMASMDKKTMLHVLANLEKLLDNIPEEELKQIGATLAKEFKEHPDEMLKLLSSGTISQVFLTPSLVKTASAIGISWFTLNFVTTWAIEAWLADMQLKAGRLGVMKAIESLDDPAYYANVEQMNNNQNKNINNDDKKVSSIPQTFNTPVSGNLLKKFQTK